jgi:hypothetical protein
MKKTLKLVSLLAITASVVFSSCSKEEEAPTPTVYPEITTVSSSDTIGTQQSAEGSYLVTASGLVQKSDAFAADPTLADLDLVELPISSSPRKMYFISPDTRAAEGFTAKIPTNANTTYIEKYTGSVAFTDIAKEGISTIETPTTKKVEIENGATYKFVTKAGKKGLLKVTYYSFSDNVATNGIKVDIKVQK